MKPSLKKKGGVVNDPSTSQTILSELLSKWQLILKAITSPVQIQALFRWQEATRSHPQVLAFAPRLPTPTGKGGNKNWWLQDQPKQEKNGFENPFQLKQTRLYPAKSASTAMSSHINDLIWPYDPRQKQLFLTPFLWAFFLSFPASSLRIILSSSSSVSVPLPKAWHHSIRVSLVLLLPGQQLEDQDTLSTHTVCLFRRI